MTYAEMTCKAKIMYILKKTNAKLQEHEIVTEWARITGNEPFGYSESNLSRRLREMVKTEHNITGYKDDMGNIIFLVNRLRPGTHYCEWFIASSDGQEDLF